MEKRTILMSLFYIFVFPFLNFFSFFFFSFLLLCLLDIAERLLLIPLSIKYIAQTTLYEEFTSTSCTGDTDSIFCKWRYSFSELKITSAYNPWFIGVMLWNIHAKYRLLSNFSSIFWKIYVILTGFFSIV